MDNALHIYLANKPAVTELGHFLKMFGFSYVPVEDSPAEGEPEAFEWRWALSPFEDHGFTLRYFNGLHHDSEYFGKCKALIVLDDSRDGDISANMMDVMAAITLNRYGGILHNPTRLDARKPDYFICGLRNS